MSSMRWVSATIKWLKTRAERRQAIALEALQAELDVLCVADMAICATRVQQCEAVIERVGLLVRGRGGAPVANPFVTIADMYRGVLFRWMRQLEMRPASPSKIGVPVPPEVPSAFEEYLAEMGHMGHDEDDESPADRGDA